MASELEYTQLRKRTGRTLGRDGPPNRERSKEPPVLRRSDANRRLSPVVEGDAIWEKFKELVASNYPDVAFPDEYIDDGIVTSTITSEDHSHVGEAIRLSKGAMKASVDGGRLLIEFDTGVFAAATKENRNNNNAPTRSFLIYGLLVNPRFWMVMTWLGALALTVRFIIHNKENYMKLL